jgi:hypothetical protein
VSAPCIVGHAVPGIVESGVRDPDRVLRDLLIGAIEDVRELQSPQPEITTAPPQPVEHV